MPWTYLRLHPQLHHSGKFWNNTFACKFRSRGTNSHLHYFPSRWKTACLPHSLRTLLHDTHAFFSNPLCLAVLSWKELLWDTLVTQCGGTPFVGLVKHLCWTRLCTPLLNTRTFHTHKNTLFAVFSFFRRWKVCVIKSGVALANVF